MTLVVFAVAVTLSAQQASTPEERLKQMAELQEKLGRKDGGDDDARKELELTGTIRTADGSPLPKRTGLHARSTTGNSSTWQTLSVGKKGAFKEKIKDGKAQVWVEAPGYAPAFSPTVVASEDEKGTRRYPPVDVVLTKGFEGDVRLVNAADGKPVAGAAVTLEYQLDPDEKNTFSLQQKGVSDASGRFILPNAAERSVRVTVECPGFQYDQTVFPLAPGKPAEVKVHPARPTTGVVLDAETRQPLAGATLTLIARDGFNSQTYYPNPEASGSKPPLLGKTDPAGRFVLDTLRDDTTYTLWVSAAGHGSAQINNVRAGEQNLEWTLGPSRAVQIEVHSADPKKMPTHVSVSNPLRHGNGSYDHQVRLKLTVEDGVGMAELPDPIPGKARVYAGGENVSFDVPRPAGAGPIVIDLGKMAAEKKQYQQREVIVRLDYPKDGPAPKGRLRISHIEPENPRVYHTDMIEPKEGEARLSVAVPTKLAYSQGELVGYWIDEKSEIEVPPGDGPFVVEVPASPAGAVHGAVTDEKGKPFTEYFSVSLETITQSPEVTNDRRPSMQQPYNSNDGSGKFLLSPLPMGGTYRLVAAAGPRYAVSEEIALDGDNVVREIKLSFVEGVTLEGQVLGPDAKPVADSEVQLLFNSGHGSFGTIAKLDRDGRFRFEHVNAQAGSYELSVKPGRGTQGLRVSPVVPDGTPLALQVEAGLTLKGKLLDAETDKPMASVKVMISPKDYESAKYRGTIEAMTDEKGEFELRGLEPIEYRLQAPDTFSPSAEILRDDNGKVTGVRTSGSDDSPIVTGGQSDPVEFKRMRSPFN